LPESVSRRSVSTNIEQNIFRDFQQWAGNYAATGPAERTRLLADGLSLAAERRRILAELIESDPAEALRQAVPMRLRQQLPPEIVAQLEERVTGHGDFDVIAKLPLPDGPRDPNFRPIDRYVRFNDRTYYAHVYGRRLGQVSREHIPMDGIAIDGQMAVHEDPVRALEAGEVPNPNLAIGNPDEICGVSGLPSGRMAAAQVGDELVYLCAPSHIAEYNQQVVAAESSLPGPSWTMGMKTVLFMRLNFSDHLQETVSEADAIATMNTASNWLFQFSYGLTSLKATVTPLLMMPRTKAFYVSSQNYTILMEDARAVARAQGFETASFDLDCVVHPFIFSYGSVAFATMGAKGVWFQAQPTVATAVHEFGHNLGLPHAHAWITSDDSIIGEGVHEEYGNPYDVMGSGRTVDAHFNSWAKNQLNWIPDRNVSTVRTSGVYRLYAFDTLSVNANFTYAFKIAKDPHRTYWLEYRNRDFFSERWCRFGLLIYSVDTNNIWNPYLFDMLPAQGGPAAPLLLGQTFTDPFAGVHLTPLRVQTNSTPGFIDFAVQFGESPNNRPPAVTLSANPPSVEPGDSVTFTATASDPDGDPLAYYWHFSDSVEDIIIGTNGPVITRQFLYAQDFVIRCTVSDMRGGISSAHHVIRVGSNSLHTLSGFVRAGSSPLEGVRVRIDGPYSGHTYTDGNGRYMLANLSAGDYTLSGLKPGWSFAPSGFANPVNVSTTITNINLAASEATYTISGRVFTGQTLEPSVGIPGALIIVGTNSVFTDADGYYAVSNLRPGFYPVSASKPHYELLRAGWWFNPVGLTWANARNVEFVRPFYKLRGSVNNIGGSPAVVRVDGQPYSVSLVRGQFAYEIEVPRGVWNLTAASDGYTIVPQFNNPAVVANEDLVPYNFIGSPGTTYAIRGTVTEAGQPLSGALITAGQRSGGSDTFGNYVLPGLPNGTYTISAAHPAYTFIPFSRSAVVNDADLVGADFMANVIFHLTQPRATAQGFEFNLIGGSNRIFRIETSTNLATWTTLATVTNAGGQVDFQTPSANAGRFYRAVLLPSP